MSEIIVGCTVRLKSGGPRMTVVEIESGSAHCVWFEVYSGFSKTIGPRTSENWNMSYGDLKSNIFKLESLLKVKD